MLRRRRFRQIERGFGSTQATILALKALLEHAETNRRAVVAGALVLKSDGQEIGRREFAAGHNQAIVLEGIEGEQTPGENELTVSLTGETQMPYVLDVAYRMPKPASYEDCPVRLATTLSSDKAAAGDVVRLTAELSNVSGKGQPITIAIVGVPAGLEIRPERLEELQKAQ